MTLRGHNERAMRLSILVDDAKQGLERVADGEADAIVGWLAYGAALNEGRSLFPGDREFGQWVQENNLHLLSRNGLKREAHAAIPCRNLATAEVNRDERAAAMWAAANSEQFEEARAEGNARTVRGIHAKWKEIEAEREAEERRKLAAEARREAEAKAREEAAAKQAATNAKDPEEKQQATERAEAATAARLDAEEAAQVAEAEAPAPVLEKDDPHRKGLSGLSREGLEDEVAGLRAALADEIAARKAVEAERDELKQRVRDLSEANQGRAISRLHAQIVTLKGAQKDAMAKAAKETRRANFFEAELKKARKSLEGQEVEI